MPIDFYDMQKLIKEINRDMEKRIAHIEKELQLLNGRYRDLLERIGQIETEMEGGV